LTPLRSSIAAAALAAAAIGCSHNDAPTPLSLADATTRAVYATDYNATTEHFDDELKKQATRASIGELSDRLHALGAFKTITQVNGVPDRGEYTFDAAFDQGHRVVELRIDPNGKIGAYRVLK